MPRSIAELGTRFPGSRVYFEALPSREIVQLLVAEEADVAITSAALDHPALESCEIGKWSLICALPQSHPLARAARPSLRQMLRERLIVYSPDAPQSKAIDGWLARHEVDRQVAVEVRSGCAACSMAAAGAGVAFVDDLSARAHRPEGIVFRSIPNTARFPVYTVINRNRPPSQLGKAFLELARKKLQALQLAPLTQAP